MIEDEKQHRKWCCVMPTDAKYVSPGYGKNIDSKENAVTVRERPRQEDHLRQRIQGWSKPHPETKCQRYIF
jgi:hypothetical protein